MPNRFRDPTLRTEYDAVTQMYGTKHRNLFTPKGERSSGNSMACFFWHGFDGVVIGPGWGEASKKTLAYAYWRAGQDAKAPSESTVSAICPECGAAFLFNRHRRAKSPPCCSRPCSKAYRIKQSQAGVVPWKSTPYLDKFDAAAASMPVTLISSWWRLERANGHSPHEILYRLNIALGAAYNKQCFDRWVLHGNLPIPVRRFMMGVVMRNSLPSCNIDESLLDRLL